MEYALAFIFLSIREICRRYLLIFLIGAVVVSLVIGGIAVAAGGAFLVAVKVTFIACLVIGLIAGVITTICARN